MFHAKESDQRYLDRCHFLQCLEFSMLMFQQIHPDQMAPNKID